MSAALPKGADERGAAARAGGVPHGAWGAVDGRVAQRGHPPSTVAGAQYPHASTDAGMPVALWLSTLLDDPGLGLEVVAGWAGIDARGPIRWAHISDTPDPTPWLEGGECC
jgi:hypothetical protein